VSWSSGRRTSFFGSERKLYTEEGVAYVERNVADWAASVGSVQRKLEGVAALYPSVRGGRAANSGPLAYLCASGEEKASWSYW
jgi:hypothetical protein